jgi:hypothetical protein
LTGISGPDTLGGMPDHGSRTEQSLTTIGILGAGRVASVLATGLAGAGHDIIIGTRTGTPPAEWKGPEVTFADHAGAGRDASVVINATPGDSALDRLSALRTELAGKILVDVSNALVRGEDGQETLCYPNSSLAEHLQAALPDTHVVKTLNTMLFSVMAAPHILATPPTVFLSGDDKDAKVVVAGLLGDLGWPAEWIDDLGDILTARGPEAFLLLVPHIMKARGFSPFALVVAT